MGPRRIGLVLFAVVLLIVFSLLYARCLVPELNAGKKETWMTTGKGWALYFIVLGIIFLLVTIAVA